MAKIEPRTFIQAFAFATLLCSSPALAQGETAPDAAVEPQTADLWAVLAKKAADEGRLDEAIEAVGEALRLAPEDERYLRMRIDLATWAGRYDLAESDLALLLQRYEDKTQMRRLALVQSWQGKLGAAIETLRAYQALYPDDPDTWLDRARIESWRGDYTESLDLLDEYRARGGDAQIYSEERALVLAWADRPKAALRLTEGEVEEHPTRTTLLYSEAVAFSRAGRYADSFERYERLSELRPDGADVHLLGRVLRTPFRPYVQGDIEYSRDSDTIEIVDASVHGGYHFSYETQLTAGAGNRWLSADAGSGLERVDGGEEINVREVFGGITQQITPRWRLAGEIGGASLDRTDDNLFTYKVETVLRPSDTIRIQAKHDRNYHAVSPRALSLDISRRQTSLGLTYSPNLQWVVEAGANYTTFSDDNQRVGGYLAARRSVLRTKDVNLDIGASATVTSFDKDLANGYYDPELFENYAALTYLYYKINDDDGVSLVISLGAQHDDDMTSYHFAGNAIAQGYFGIYRDWMLKVHAGVSYGLSDFGSSYTAGAAGLSLIRRF